MTVTRIGTDTVSSLYTVDATFTFAGASIGGIGATLPVDWSDSVATLKWPLMFADAPTGTGIIQVTVPELNYLPSQDAGFVSCQGIITPLKYSMVGTIQGSMTIKPNVLVTMFCFLSKYPLVSM